MRLKRETLQVAEQATVFSDLQGLTDAIAEKVISMPQISLVHSNIAPSPPTAPQTVVNDGVTPRSKLASTIRLIQSLNARQKLPVQHVVLSFLSRSLSSSLDPHKDLISAMGYTLSSQVIHTSRNGSPADDHVNHGVGEGKAWDDDDEEEGEEDEDEDEEDEESAEEASSNIIFH
mgnify:CR=1 FL=1